MDLWSRNDAATRLQPRQLLRRDSISQPSVPSTIASGRLLGPLDSSAHSGGHHRAGSFHHHEPNHSKSPLMDMTNLIRLILELPKENRESVLRALQTARTTRRNEGEQQQLLDSPMEVQSNIPIKVKVVTGDWT